jgi:hypothetical protein
MLCVIGICIARFAHNSDLSALFALIAVASAGVLIIWGLTIIVNIYGNESNLIKYEQDKSYIESCYNNTQLTDNERQKLNELIIKDNNIISLSERWKDNIWIGILYSDKIANLKKFDLSKVNPAKLKVEATITK